MSEDNPYPERLADNKLSLSKNVASIGMFTALSVVCGYLLIMVPNVELMTVMISISGLFLGAYGGALVGVFSVTIFNGINTWGLPYPPVWIAQMTSMGLNGLFFGSFRRVIFSSGITRKIIIFVASGFILTLLYDFLTTIAFPVSTGIEPGKGWIPFLAAGVPFTLIHVVSNIAIYAVVPSAIVSRFKKFNNLAN